MNDSIPFQNQPLACEKLAFERKVFYIDLKENARGRYLKITEDVGGRRDTIIVPIAAAREMLEAMTRLADYEAKLTE
jgi:hypothetical protein